MILSLLFCVVGIVIGFGITLVLDIFQSWWNTLSYDTQTVAGVSIISGVFGAIVWFLLVFLSTLE